MGTVANKKKATTPEERRAKRAFTVEGKIKKGCSAIRAAWGALAGFLYELQREELWRDLGHDSFEAWLASPDIDLGRSQVYALIECYRELVLEREVPLDELKGLEVTKLSQVLPALRREEVELADAISDCESLSRSDLREKYRKSGAGGRAAKAFEKCDLCGKQRVVDGEQAPQPHPDQLDLENAEVGGEKGGVRAERAVELIAANPGITAKEIAEQMGVKPNFLYRILGDLDKEGRIEKQGRKYMVVVQSG